VTAQGHPRAIFTRAIQRGNLVAADLTGGRSQPTIDAGMGDDLIRGAAACYSSGTAGRAIVQIRRNHLVTDDPSEPSSYYQGPGEAPGSLELFLGGIVSCAVLMLERIARSEGRTLGPIRAEMEATRDPTSTSQPPVLDSARLTFIFQGMTSEEAGTWSRRSRDADHCTARSRSRPRTPSWSTGSSRAPSQSAPPDPQLHHLK
jgi:uncharacterized OsmC-like protein